MIDIYSLESFTHQINIGSFEQNIFFDLNEVMTTTNLSEIKDKAINELGMVYATSNQIVYYSVDGSDYMSQYHDIP